MSSGEKKGWEGLKALGPDSVCKRTGAVFNEQTGKYALSSFGTEISVFPKDETISGSPGLSGILLDRLGYFSRLSIIWYLVKFKDLPPSGKLIKPVNLKGGELFFRGSHILPLDKLAGKYSSDAAAFLSKGEELGGEKLNYGDASLRLYPFPKFSVELILWKEDEEFQARLDLLLDSNSELQLPLDIIWSISMLSLLMMM
ncbi:MAG: DUF3786 domain-containing protein [Nitrospirae bacterium]|nr:DUF3786 domain-containing protein [Nitrospirota bacterium]